MKVEYLILGIFACLLFAAHTLCLTKKRLINFAISGLFSAGALVLFWQYGPKYGLEASPLHGLYLTAIFVIIALYGYFFGSVAYEQEIANTKTVFRLESFRGKKIEFGNPYDNFLVYAGANAGKTKSIGKPLLEQYIQHGFAGFIYDYKDFDYTKTAYNMIKKHNYKHPFYHISFSDVNRTYRFNPIKPSVLDDENLLVQLMDDV